MAEKMNKTAIESALELVCDKFDLVDIKLIDTHLKVAEQEALAVGSEPKVYKSFNLSRKEKLFIATDDDDKSKPIKYIFIYRFGIRLAVSEEAMNSPDYEVEGCYMAKYNLKLGAEAPPQDHLDLFADINVPHNLWPFWRELVHSLLSKAGLGSVVLPLRHIRVQESTNTNVQTS